MDHIRRTVGLRNIIIARPFGTQSYHESCASEALCSHRMAVILPVLCLISTRVMVRMTYWYEKVFSYNGTRRSHQRTSRQAGY